MSENRSQQLSSDLNRLYGRLGNIIEELHHESNIKETVNVVIDVPSDRRARYTIRVSENQGRNNYHSHCYQCNHCEQKKFCSKREEERDEEEQPYTISVNNVPKTNEEPARVEEPTQPQPIVVPVPKTTEEYPTQTEPSQTPKVSVTVQVDQPPRPLPQLQTIKIKPQSIQNNFPSIKVKEVIRQSQIMSSNIKNHVNKTPQRQKDSTFRYFQSTSRVTNLNQKLRNNFQRVDRICTATMPQRPKKQSQYLFNCKYLGCRCKGVIENKVRSRTPTFNSYKFKYSKKDKQYQPYRSHEGRLIQERKKSDRQIVNMMDYISKIKQNYLNRSPESVRTDSNKTYQTYKLPANWSDTRSKSKDQKSKSISTPQRTHYLL